MKKKTSTGNS